MSDTMRNIFKKDSNLDRWKKSCDGVNSAIKECNKAHYDLLCMQIVAECKLYKEPEARKWAEESGLLLKPLESAINYGSKKLYDYCLCLMAHGVPDMEDLSRKIAEIYDFSYESLENALEKGSTINDARLDSITGNEINTSYDGKVGYPINRLKSKFLDDESGNEIHDPDALIDEVVSDKPFFRRLKDWLDVKKIDSYDVMMRSSEEECMIYLRETGLN